MTLYKVNCEIVMLVNAANIDEAEEMVKNTFNETDRKFRQILDIKEKN